MYQISIELKNEAYALFKSEEAYKTEMKRQMALQLAEKLLDSKHTTFTYIPDPQNYGARLIARIKINEI